MNFSISLCTKLTTKVSHHSRRRVFAGMISFILASASASAATSIEQRQQILSEKIVAVNGCDIKASFDDQLFSVKDGCFIYSKKTAAMVSKNLGVRNYLVQVSSNANGELLREDLIPGSFSPPFNVRRAEVVMVSFSSVQNIPEYLAQGLETECQNLRSQAESH